MKTTSEQRWIFNKQQKQKELSVYKKKSYNRSIIQSALFFENLSCEKHLSLFYQHLFPDEGSLKRKCFNVDFPSNKFISLRLLCFFQFFATHNYMKYDTNFLHTNHSRNLVPFSRVTRISFVMETRGITRLIGNTEYHTNVNTRQSFF